MADDSTTQCLLFPEFLGKPLIARFDQHYGSSDGGAVLLKAIDLRLGLTERLARLAIVDAVSGNSHQARRLLGRLKTESARRYVSPVLPAYVHAALDEKDSAFALLEDVYAAKDPLLIPIQACLIQGMLSLSEERAAALRSDPRFGDLVRRMGFVPRAPALKPGGPS